MKIVYLIYENPNDYETSPFVIGFKETEDEAKDIVKSKCEEYNSVIEFMALIYKEMNRFEESNPIPKFTPTLDILKWVSLSQNDISQEMRDERKNIELRNLEIDNSNSLKLKVYQLNKMEFIKPLIATRDTKWLSDNFIIADTFIQPKDSLLSKDNPYFYEECSEIISN